MIYKMRIFVYLINILKTTWNNRQNYTQRGVDKINTMKTFGIIFIEVTRNYTI